MAQDISKDDLREEKYLEIMGNGAWQSSGISLGKSNNEFIKKNKKILNCPE